MHRTIISLLLALASSAAAAEGFAPWTGRAPTPAAAAEPGVVVTPGPFYGAGLPAPQALEDASQATITIAPYYRQSS
jgi:hypothetical protein